MMLWFSPQTMKRIIGLGSPIVDEIAFIEESFLTSISGAKRGMELLLNLN